MEILGSRLPDVLISRYPRIINNIANDRRGAKMLLHGLYELHARVLGADVDLRGEGFYAVGC